MQLIPDLSNNNAHVDFARLAAVPGVVGVYLKASEGRTFTDHTFAERAREARAHGLRVGGYHFARGGNVAAEAVNFARALGTVERRDLRPVLDAEVSPGPAWAAWVHKWIELTWESTGVLPGIYSYPYWLEQLRLARPVGEFLWLASWGRDDGQEHAYRVPAPWKRASLHQFTSKGRVAGVAGLCDLSSTTTLRPLLAHPVAGLP